MRFLPSIAFALLATTGCVIAEQDSSLLVENRSDFEVHEMYVAEVASPTWGPNLLRGDVLYPGDSILVGIECGTYDALLIDETGAACEVFSVDLCFDDAEWIIRNNTCALFEARAAAAAKTADPGAANTATEN